MARRNDGKMDKRTTEYKEAAARMKKARAAAATQRGMAPKAVAKSAAKRSGPRRADGQLDQRTAEGREMAARMAALRAKRGKGKVKGFFNWIFGG
jgi:hypothetical protein